MNTFADAIGEDGGAVSFTIGTATLVADALYIQQSAKDIVDALTKKEAAFESQVPTTLTPAVKADDFILRPGQDPIQFNKGDLIIGGTNLDGGGTSRESSNNRSNIGQQVANAIAGMSFVVNNTFNGEDIITAMEIMQGNKMNA